MHLTLQWPARCTVRGAEVKKYLQLQLGAVVRARLCACARRAALRRQTEAGWKFVCVYTVQQTRWAKFQLYCATSLFEFQKRTCFL